MNYIIITPVHNESQYLELFIKSIISQTRRPLLMVLVDDNSTDDSARIIKKFCEQYNWIEYVYRQSDSKKIQGSKVIQTFNFGYERSKVEKYDYDVIAKLDADLEMPPKYFEEVLAEFRGDPKLGLCGGQIKEFNGQEWKLKKSDSYHIRGALKSYRKECFESIGGLMPVYGWDGLDEMKLFQLGWKTKNISLEVKHFRPADADYNPVKLSFKRGRVNYQNGGNLILMLIRVLKRIPDKPFLIVSFAFMVGYLNAFILRRPKNVSKDLEKFINNFHMNRIIRKRKNEDLS